MVDTHHADEERDSTPRQFPPKERNIPPANEQYSNQWEDDNREPEVIVEHVPVLNGGPPTSQSEWETIPEGTRTVTTTPVVTTRTTSIEAVSISLIFLETLFLPDDTDVKSFRGMYQIALIC